MLSILGHISGVTLINPDSGDKAQTIGIKTPASKVSPLFTIDVPDVFDAISANFFASKNELFRKSQGWVETL